MADGATLAKASLASKSFLEETEIVLLKLSALPVKTKEIWFFMAFVLIVAVAALVNLLFLFYAKSQIREGISREELEEDVLIFMIPIDVVIFFICISLFV